MNRDQRSQLSMTAGATIASPRRTTDGLQSVAAAVDGVENCPFGDALTPAHNAIGTTVTRPCAGVRTHAGIDLG